eukprot:4276475-Prymnesium_polylepis.2
MSLSIDVTVLLNAAPVADHCTLVGGMVYVDILEQAVVRFVARDLDRLPTVTKAEFAGTHAWCGLTPDEYPAVQDEGGGNFSARFTPGRPGLHQVRLNLLSSSGAQALPAAWVWASCRAGEFATQALEGNATCLPCVAVEGTDCHSTRPPVTLASLPLARNYWRLTNASTQISRCSPRAASTNHLRCLGGREAGLYCAEAFQGPLCRVCVDPRSYLDADGLGCGASVVAVTSCLLLGVLLLLYASRRILRKVRAVQRWAWHAAALASRIGLVQKLKLVCGFFQVAFVIPAVYIVGLPPQYENSVGIFHVFSLNWLGVLRWSPTCIGSFGAQISFEAVLPLMLVAARRHLGAARRASCLSLCARGLPTRCQHSPRAVLALAATRELAHLCRLLVRPL